MDKNKKFELISALVDDALVLQEDIDEAISLLLRDPECQKKWEKYHLIGSVLRSRQLGVAPTSNPSNVKLKIKTSSKSPLVSSKIFKIGLPLVASVATLTVGVGFFINQNYSFAPNQDQMKMALADKSDISRGYDVVEDVEYATQQRSLDNHFLRAHEKSSNTGGIIRVSFPNGGSGR